MFEATGWVLEEEIEGNPDELVLAYVKPPHAGPSGRQARADSLLSISDASMNGKAMDNTYQLALIRRFDFSSKL